MGLPRVYLARDFNENTFDLYIDGNLVTEDERLTASTVLAYLSDYNVIEYHEIVKVRDDEKQPEPDEE